MQTSQAPALGLAVVSERRPHEKPLKMGKSKTVANEWLAKKHSFFIS